MIIWEFVQDAAVLSMKGGLTVCVQLHSIIADDTIEIDVLEDVLNDYGYDLDDFESGIMDEDELEEILDEVEN